MKAVLKTKKEKGEDKVLPFAKNVIGSALKAYTMGPGEYLKRREDQKMARQQMAAKIASHQADIDRASKEAEKNRQTKYDIARISGMAKSKGSLTKRLDELEKENRELGIELNMSENEKEKEGLREAKSLVMDKIAKLQHKLKTLK